MIKQKKTILLRCIAVILLAITGIAILLCVGCDTDDTPGGVQGETTAGDQITGDLSNEGQTIPPDEKTDSVETDGVQDPTESQTDSDSPEEPLESNTDKPETTTEPEPEETIEEPPITDSESMTFEEYHALSAEKQEAYFLSFASPTDFFAWYNAAKEKYMEENPGIEIGPDGSIPLP